MYQSMFQQIKSWIKPTQMKVNLKERKQQNVSQIDDTKTNTQEPNILRIQGNIKQNTHELYNEPLNSKTKSLIVFILYCFIID